MSVIGDILPYSYMAFNPIRNRIELITYFVSAESQHVDEQSYETIYLFLYLQCENRIGVYILYLKLWIIICG